MTEQKNKIKSITPEEFSKLDFNEITLVDLREKDEVLVNGIQGAINIPFSEFSTGLDQIPREKKVYVLCRTGDWSEEVVEILTDRGYDAVNVTGGYQAYRIYIEQSKPVFVDAKGMKCPGPVVKVADELRTLKSGQRVYVEATEDAFASDIKVWCERTGNKLLKLDKESELIKALIEKTDSKPDTQNNSGKDELSLPNGKTFVVFSGDLDKTIATFIMANGRQLWEEMLPFSSLFGD